MKVIRDKAIEEEMEVTAMRESCSNTNKPCACVENMMGEMLRKSHGGGLVAIQYPEFSCDKKLNDMRRDEGRIPIGYECTQMTNERTIRR